jgi:hypothetical protein
MLEMIGWVWVLKHNPRIQGSKLVSLPSCCCILVHSKCQSENLDYRQMLSSTSVYMTVIKVANASIELSKRLKLTDFQHV